MSQSRFDDDATDRSSVFACIAACQDDGLRHQARLAFMRLVERMRALETDDTARDTLRDLPTVKIPSVPPGIDFKITADNRIKPDHGDSCLMCRAEKT